MARGLDKQSGDVQDYILDNPFLILEIVPGSSGLEIERQGKKILGMLELEIPGAGAYESPLGSRKRDKDLVRQAVSELRDPLRYHFHAFWYLEPGETQSSGKQEKRQGDGLSRESWMAAAGFRR